jgi:hypothetical protein
MPTATSLSQYTLTDLGPLTTTFTAPTTCATPANIQVAPRESPESITWAANCILTQRYECTPSGDKVSSAMATMDTADPAFGFQISYYSPGLICPSGWLTVGSVEIGGDGRRSGSGVFLPPQTATTTTSTAGGGASSADSDSDPPDPAFPQPLDVLADALLSSETAILCCPSSFTPAQSAGWCYSTLPSYTPSTGCVRLLPTSDIDEVSTQLVQADGSTSPAVLLTLTATAPATETILTTFAPDAVKDLVGLTVQNMVTLVHRAADVNASSATSGIQRWRGRRRPTSSVWNREGANFALLIALVAAVLGLVVVLA